jgi:hypothetical protein
VIAAAIVVLGWWFLIRTPMGYLEVTVRPNPNCPRTSVLPCSQVPRGGKLFLYGGPTPNPGSYDPGSSFFHVIDVDWSHPTLHLKLAPGHYWINFLIPPQTALPTDRGNGYSVDIHEGATLQIGVLMPSDINDSFPAYGD